jgi:hypothetical protein
MSCGPQWLQRLLTEAPKKTSQRRETQGFKKEKSCPQTKFKSGPRGLSSASTTLATQRGGKYADAMVTEYNARYYQATKDGMSFTVANQAVVTTTVGLALTYTGLVLSNPITSQVDLVIVQVSMMQSVIQATQVEAFAIATGFNSTTNVTHTAAVTPKSSLIGSGLTGTGLADSSATLPTAPFYDTFITNTGTATADSTGVQVVDIAGSIVLKPGGYALWVTPAQASVAGMWFGFKYFETAV